MSELKLYVMDHGWEGADMFITDSEDDARAHFLSDNVAIGEDGLAKHMAAHPNRLPNPWPDRIDYWKSGKFWKDVDVYPISKGFALWTAGDN